MMKKLYLTLLCLFMVLAGLAQSQQKSNEAGNKAWMLSGTVVDFETGKPIPGASVIIAGTTSGTATDKSGLFTIKITGSDVKIEASFIGYAKQIVSVGRANNLNIRLKENTNELDEVVVVGYGAVTRRDLTGAVAKADMESMRKAPVTNFEDALAGRMAGVQVGATDGQPGAEKQIVIRGNNSVTQDNSPLYVIDGFPMEESVGNILNSEEIESIDVLKDASATAIYGARGANGVILLTTKKGKNSAAVVTYNGWVGLHQVTKTQELLSPYEFVKYQLEMNPTLYEKYYLTDGKTLEDYRNAKGIDWQKEVFRDAFVHNHNIAVRGGTDMTRYSISGSLTDQEGVILNSGFDKYQGRFVIDQQINKKVKVGVNLNYTSTKKYGNIVAESQSSPTASFMYSLWGYRPITGNESADLLNELYDPDVDAGTDYRVNPVMSAKNESNNIVKNTFIANAYFQYQITNGLMLRITGGMNKVMQKRELFFNSQSRGGNLNSKDKINGLISSSDKTTFLNENTLTYNVPLKKGHKLDLLGGFTIEEQRLATEEIKAILVPNESLGIAGLDEGQITSAPITRPSNGIVSLLARVNYNYKSKYLLTASFRADGSSKFPKENRWGYFPSVSAAWTFSEEKFIKDINVISFGKIRGGIGATGNNRVGDYSSLTSLQILSDSGYGIGNSPEVGVVPTTLGNRNLKWETTVQSNVGLDLGLFNNRLNITADYYYKETKDLLLNATLAPSMGFLNAYKNVGSVSNEGFELTLHTTNIETKDFLWTSDLNISFNRNKVLSLNDDEPSLATRVTWGNFNNAYPYIAIPGHPIALFYGHIFDGVYQYSDFDGSEGNYTLKAGVPNNGDAREKIQPGDIKFRDINDDGVVNENDLTIIGNPNPKHIGGFNNNFRYKNFDLNIFLQWSYGGDVLNANRIEFEGGDPNPRNFLNMFASFADRWTPENQTNKLYRVGGKGPAVYSSRTIEDGSFLRLKTVSLGYRLPSSLLKKIHIQSIRVYASAQNLATWSSYSGLDPEVSTRHTALTPSFDWSAYPTPRILTFGIDVTF